MQLLELELHNIKSYTEATIAFTEGVNGIVGANGAGKSTLLEAIGYVLFNSRTPGPTSLLRQGRRTGSIRVRFLNRHDGLTYDVVRYLGRNRHYVHNCDEDYQVCEGRQDVQAFLQQAIGETPGISLEALFQQAIGVPQGSFQSPFLATPANRKAYFGPLLDVSKYRDAFDRLRGTENHIRGLVQEKELEEARLATQLAPRETKEQEREALAQDADRLRQQIRDRESQLQAITEQSARWDQAAEALRQTQRDRDELQREFMSLEVELALAADNLSQAREAHRLVERHQPDHARYQEAEQAMTQVRQELRARAELEIRLAQIVSERDTRQERQQTLAAQGRQLEAMQREADQLQETVAEHSAVEEQLRPLAVTAASLAAAEAELQAVAQRLAQTRGERDETAARIEQGLQLQEQAAQADKQAQQAAARWQELERKHIRVQTQLEGLVDQEDALYRISEADDLPEEEVWAPGLCPICQQPLTHELQRDLLARNHHQRGGVQEEWDRLQAQLDTVHREHQAHRQMYEDCQSQAQQLPDKSDLYAVNAQLEALDQEHTRRVQDLADMQQALAQKEELQALQATLHPAVARHAEIMAQLALSPAIQEETEALASQLDLLEGDLQACRAQASAFAGLEEREARVNAELETHRAGYELVISHADRAGKLDEHAQQFAALEQQKAALDIQADELDARLAVQAQAYDASRHAQLRQELDALRTAQTRAETEYEHVEAACARLDKELAELQAVAAKWTQVTQELTELRRRHEHLGFLRPLLQEIQPRITAALIDSISQEAAHFYRDIMDDATKHLQWTEDFGIQIRVDGQDRDYRQLSGGEQMTAALAVILAVLRSLTTLQFAFFDEPTTNLDEARRTELAQQIRKITGFKQLFIISHDDTFEASLDNAIHIAKTNDISQQVSAS